MGRPIVHWELISNNSARVADFYEKIFGWKTQHMPEMNYRLVDTGGEGGINGGIMQPPPDQPMPANMTMYIDVENLAEYRKRIESAGGKIILEQQEVPGMGSLSLFTDPDGRMMGLWQAAGK